MMIAVVNGDRGVHHVNDELRASGDDGVGWDARSVAVADVHARKGDDAAGLLDLSNFAGLQLRF